MERLPQRTRLTRILSRVRWAFRGSFRTQGTSEWLVLKEKNVVKSEKSWALSENRASTVSDRKFFFGSVPLRGAAPQSLATTLREDRSSTLLPGQRRDTGGGPAQAFSVNSLIRPAFIFRGVPRPPALCHRVDWGTMTSSQNIAGDARRRNKNKQLNRKREFAEGVASATWFGI